MRVSLVTVLVKVETTVPKSIVPLEVIVPFTAPFSFTATEVTVPAFLVKPHPLTVAEVTAAGIVGLFDKSLYEPLVATVANPVIVEAACVCELLAFPSKADFTNFSLG